VFELIKEGFLIGKNGQIGYTRFNGALKGAAF
jgi:hypothetical protein